MCLPGLSLVVSALCRWPCSISILLSRRSVTGVSLSLGHEAFLFICVPGPSLLVPCSISIHLSFRSVTGGVRPCPLAMKHFYSCVSQVRNCCCRPFSVGHVAFLFICLPGLSLLVSALFVGHAAFLFICLPGLSLLVSALFRWRCNISIHCFPGLSLLVSALFRWACNMSIHLFPGSVTGAAALFRWPCSISIHLSPM